MTNEESKLKIVTGGAGFIDSNLVGALLAGNHQVRRLHNFITGKREFLLQHLSNSSLEIFDADLSDVGVCKSVVTGGEAIFRLAVNADFRHGWDHSLLAEVIGTICIAHDDPLTPHERNGIFIRLPETSFWGSENSSPKF